MEAQQPSKDEKKLTIEGTVTTKLTGTTPTMDYS